MDIDILTSMPILPHMRHSFDDCTYPRIVLYINPGTRSQHIFYHGFTAASDGHSKGCFLYVWKGIHMHVILIKVFDGKVQQLMS